MDRGKEFNAPNNRNSPLRIGEVDEYLQTKLDKYGENMLHKI